MRHQHPWATWSEDALLDLPMKALDVQVKDTWIEGCVENLYEELALNDLRVRPHVWLSDEWFSPDNTPGIAIPFYLAHPRLMRLERKMMLEVEGGTPVGCMRILRHEAGHVVQHAFNLHRLRQWQQLFGSSSQPYPDLYRPNPASKNHVQHLRMWYAQSHPDEDFAETFAVWLKPRSSWRKRYAEWPALKKLEYVDGLMQKIAGRKSSFGPRTRVDPLKKSKFTLRQYYANKKERYTVNAPTYFDRDLLRLFAAEPRHRQAPTAVQFLRKHRSKIRQMTAKWTGEYQLTLDAVLDGMIARSKELKLRAPGADRQLMMDCTLMLVTNTVHSLYSRARREWIAL